MCELCCPYAEPNKINVKFPHDINSENGFKNTLVYADWSLGEFIKKIGKIAASCNSFQTKAKFWNIIHRRYA